VAAFGKKPDNSTQNRSCAGPEPDALINFGFGVQSEQVKPRKIIVGD
jgi:hypothetical protein